MQFVILLNDGTETKEREFDKIEAIRSIAEEIVYTNNNFIHKDRLVVGLYIDEINKFFKVEYLDKEFKSFNIEECTKEIFDSIITGPVYKMQTEEIIDGDGLSIKKKLIPEYEHVRGN